MRGLSRPTPAVGPGTRLAGYLLGEVIGRGGEATVFAARRADRPGHRFAVKVFHRADRVSSALAEARTLARLTHPGILPVHTVGQTDGVLFVALDYAGGGTLRDVVKREGPMGGVQACRRLQTVAGALAAAHAAGVAHRDVHPRNILATTEGALCLADFGLSVGLWTSTSYHAVVGTPAFIAPETWRGGGVDPAGDAYAIGACLHYAATGRDLVDNQLPIEQIREIHLAGRLRIAADLDPRVADLVRRMTAFEAARRPPMALVTRVLGELAGQRGDRPAGDYTLSSFGVAVETVDRIGRLVTTLRRGLVRTRRAVCVGRCGPWRDAAVGAVRAGIRGNVVDVSVRGARSLTHAEFLLQPGRIDAVVMTLDGPLTGDLRRRARALFSRLDCLMLVVCPPTLAPTAISCLTAASDGLSHPAPTVAHVPTIQLGDALELAQAASRKLKAIGEQLTADATLLLAELIAEGPLDPAAVLRRAMAHRAHLACPMIDTWCMQNAEVSMRGEPAVEGPPPRHWPDTSMSDRLRSLRRRLA